MNRSDERSRRHPVCRGTTRSRDCVAVLGGHSRASKAALRRSSRRRRRPLRGGARERLRPGSRRERRRRRSVHRDRACGRLSRRGRRDDRRHGGPRRRLRRHFRRRAGAQRGSHRAGGARRVRTLPARRTGRASRHRLGRRNDVPLEPRRAETHPQGRIPSHERARSHGGNAGRIGCARARSQANRRRARHGRQHGRRDHRISRRRGLDETAARGLGGTRRAARGAHRARRIPRAAHRVRRHARVFFRLRSYPGRRFRRAHARLRQAMADGRSHLQALCDRHHESALYRLRAAAGEEGLRRRRRRRGAVRNRGRLRAPAVGAALIQTPAGERLRRQIQCALQYRRRVRHPRRRVRGLYRQDGARPAHSRARFQSALRRRSGQSVSEGLHRTRQDDPRGRPRVRRAPAAHPRRRTRAARARRDRAQVPLQRPLRRLGCGARGTVPAIRKKGFR